MPEPLVRLEREGAVATLVLNDPARRNALGEALGAELAARVAELAADRGLRALVLAGAGEAFSSGGDLAMIEARAAEAARSAAGRRRVRAAMRSFYGLFLGVHELPCPTVAAIHGAAVGAGLCLALACDVRIASATARLALNFSALGLHPGMGATWLLPRLVGPSRAAELLFSGRALTGAEAAAIGLASRAVSRDEVRATARELAADFAAAGPLANRAIKRSLARSAAASLADQLDLEAAEQAATLASRDAAEGLAAARSRCRPRFPSA